MSPGDRITFYCDRLQAYRTRTVLSGSEAGVVVIHGGTEQLINFDQIRSIEHHQRRKKKCQKH